jgi:coenzyme F420 hydrogenase subunit beta
VLSVDGDEYPTVKNLSACTDCDLCVRVCPGDEFNFHEHHQELFGTPGDLTDTHGHIAEAAVGYATDKEIRDGSTSGGVVTGLLVKMLEAGEIDGAVIIGSSDAPIWKGKALVARSRAELLSGMKSKYAITTTNAVFSEIRQVPGRYAIVGLPCQIHGYRKAIALDVRLKERIVLSIGLFCHAAIEHEAYRVMFEQLGERGQRAKRFISRIGKHPGTPHLEMEDGSLYPVYFGERSGYRPSSIEVINILYRLYTPERCTTCFDGLADFADIAVGDPWMAPPTDDVKWTDGWSLVVLRTPRGQAAYHGAVTAGALSTVAVTEREARASNILMAHEKRDRAFRVMETHRRQGKPVPFYGEAVGELPRQTGVKFFKTELHMLSHLFCFLPKRRASVLKFFLGSGYWLFWANSLRRRLRVWVRDSIALIRRKSVGRS